MQNEDQFDPARLTAIRGANLSRYDGDLRWLEPIPVLLGYLYAKTIIGLDQILDGQGGWRLHAYIEETRADEDDLTCGNRYFTGLAGATLDAALLNLHHVALVMFAVRDITLFAEIAKTVFNMDEPPRRAYVMPAELRALRHAQG